jgi:hypothetical protein
MALGELKGKGLYDLSPEEFKELYCRRCLEAKWNECARAEKDIHICKGLIDCGLWDRHYKRLGS